MNIYFTPKRSDDILILEKTGNDKIKINGELFNFSSLKDGDLIPEGIIPSKWIEGAVEKRDGELHIKIILPHSSNPESYMAFPEPIKVEEDGEIDIPKNPNIDILSEEIAVSEEYPAGATKYITTIKRWHQEPEVIEEIVPNQEPEVLNVDSE